MAEIFADASRWLDSQDGVAPSTDWNPAFGPNGQYAFSYNAGKALVNLDPVHAGDTITLTVQWQLPADTSDWPTGVLWIYDVATGATLALIGATDANPSNVQVTLSQDYPAYGLAITTDYESAEPEDTTIWVAPGLDAPIDTSEVPGSGSGGTPPPPPPPPLPPPVTVDRDPSLTSPFLFGPCEVVVSVLHLVANQLLTFIMFDGLIGAGQTVDTLLPSPVAPAAMAVPRLSCDVNGVLSLTVDETVGGFGPLDVIKAYNTARIDVFLRGRASHIQFNEFESDLIADCASVGATAGVDAYLDSTTDRVPDSSGTVDIIAYDGAPAVDDPVTWDSVIAVAPVPTKSTAGAGLSIIVPTSPPPPPPPPGGFF